MTQPTFLSAAGTGLHQIITPDGRAIVNYLPHQTARTLLIDLQAMYPAVKFIFQVVPVDQQAEAA